MLFMKDPILNATDEELHSFICREPIGMMEQAFIDSAKDELERRRLIRQKAPVSVPAWVDAHDTYVGPGNE